jgi:hypothetical protein
MKYILFIIASFTMLSACRKKAVCKGNCVDIRISGRVYDLVSNTGFADVPVEVNWFYSRWCLFCTSYKVGTGKTASDGSFDFTVTVDTSYFGNDYHLNVRLPIPTGYLDIMGDGYDEARMFSYSPAGLQNLQFGYYPKTDLYIRLHRVLTDTVKHFSIDYSYQPNSTIGIYSTYVLPATSDTTLHGLTAAGKTTTVEWTKQIAPGVYNRKKDSLFCTATGPNVLDIYY